MASLIEAEGLVYHSLNALSYPCHAGNGHAVAECLVAGAIGAVCGWLSAIRYLCVVIGEPLKAFALYGSQAAHGHPHLHARTFATGIGAQRADALKRCLWRCVILEADGNRRWAAGVRMAITMISSPERGRNWPCISPMILG